MRAVHFKGTGETVSAVIDHVATPELKPLEVLIQVKACGVNRADLLQRSGKYPPPPGCSPIVGLEVSGEVVRLGTRVNQWQVGDRVCALLSGGGYAELVNAHQDLIMPIPDGVDLIEAAGIPEAFITAHQAINYLPNLNIRDNILVHAGASGVGTAVIQLARAQFQNIFCTASSPKHNLCHALGADHVIDYKINSFRDYIENEPIDGIDLIIDFVAGPYFEDHLAILRQDGVLVILGALGAVITGELSLFPILRKRLTVLGSTLRNRSTEYKAHLVHSFTTKYLPLFASDQLRVVVDSIFPIDQVLEAHQRMEQNQNQGKIILTV